MTSTNQVRMGSVELTALHFEALSQFNFICKQVSQLGERNAPITVEQVLDDKGFSVMRVCARLGDEQIVGTLVLCRYNGDQWHLYESDSVIKYPSMQLRISYDRVNREYTLRAGFGKVVTPGSVMKVRIDSKSH